jgi:trimethylamine--corrinoid protein Co-methyltransferase
VTLEGQPRRSGGRAARQAARLHAHVEGVPFLTRTLAPYQLLDDEGLATLEENADTILEEVGLIFRGDPEAVRTLRESGADVADDGERVRFPRGLCRQVVQASAPRVYTQHARNPARSVVIGDPYTVLAPNYGSPFVRDLDRGRRYGTLEDFRNLVKLTYLSPFLHHSGGTVCEPVDVPVNKRHLDMVYAHIRFSDKPFMGSVTHPERARDTVEMARILFGPEFVDANTVITSLINANSPLVWDATMLGSARAYAEANQATLITPFILAGAMAPVTAAAVCAQTLAEALAGMAFVQLVRPGAPVILGSFASSMSMQSGAPTFGTPEPALVLFTMAALARRLGVPFRSGGNLTASKVADAQAAYESAATFQPTVLAGVNFVLHAAGWLEGGLTVGYEKFILDADQCGMAGVFVRGLDMTENGQGLDAIRENGPGQHFLGTAHTLANFETAFYRSETADNNSFEQWAEGGEQDAVVRANAIWKRMLADYEPPPLDEAIDEALGEFIIRRKASMPDSDV